jgi:hypothetical protein
MTIQPPPLDYSSGRPPSPQGSWSQFSAGAFAGLVFSLLYYVALVRLRVLDGQIGLAFGAVCIKLVVGIRMMWLPRWRSFGIGLIVSIPLALLIFVGLCFVILAKL